MSLINDNYLAVVPYVSRDSHVKAPLPQFLKIAAGIFDGSLSPELKEHHHFRKYCMGDIVVLVGTSTSGKSSIIQALTALEPNRLEDGFDLRYFTKHLDSFKKYCLSEVDVIGRALKDSIDIPKAVLYGERSWKLAVSSLQKSKAECAIAKIKSRMDSLSEEEAVSVQHSFKYMEEEMFEGILERSFRGGNSIFDVSDAEPLLKYAKQRKFTAAIRVMLIYCPFSILSSRMDSRNKNAVKSGEFSNQRIGPFPLQQFSKLFGQKEQRQKSLEVITREFAIREFSDNYDKELEQAKKDGEPELPYHLQIEDKRKSEEDLLKNLGFKEGLESVEIAPKKPHLYKGVINSGILKPKESAQIIHRGTFKR